MSSHKLTLKSTSEVLDLKDLYLSEQNKIKINQLLEELTYIDALRTYNLPIDNKILLFGMTGCGKTATAHAIAKRLNKKVISLNLGGFVSSRLGETAKNINSAFTRAKIENAVLFIDEFDFIGKSRDYDQKDSGEMKRAVNVLLQQMDHLDKNTLLICATNHMDSIDSALLRRFQLKLQYDMPTKDQLTSYYQHLLGQFPTEFSDVERIYDISYAEAKDHVFQQVKGNIIAQEKMKKQRLFLYGSWLQSNMQIEVFGRVLQGVDDTLIGYKLEHLKHTVKSTNGNDHETCFSVAIKSTVNSDRLDGKIFEITTEELYLTNKGGLEDCARVTLPLESGIRAWVYLKK